MERIFNFSAGPAALPLEVLEQARDELVNWHGCGMSVMEMSHRGKEYMSIQADAEADLRELLAIPANYKVLFLQGGAFGQFAGDTMNQSAEGDEVDFLLTGDWSAKGIKEAAKYVTTNALVDEKPSNYTKVPPAGSYQVNPNAAYLH